MPSPRRAPLRPRPKRGRLGSRLVLPAGYTAPPAGAPVIREILSDEASGANASVTTGAGTQAGDTLLVLHANNFNTAANVTAPTSGTWTLAATGDNGSNGSHVKAWSGTASGGAQTITVAPTVSGEEHGLFVIVYAGACSVDAAAGGNGAATASHVAPTTSPAAYAPMQVTCVTTNAAVGATYTEPGGTTKVAEVKDPSFTFSAALGTQQLTNPGATGTTTWTSSASGGYASVSVSVAGILPNRTATLVETASGTSVTGTLPTDRRTGDYVVASFHMTCTVAQFTRPSSGDGWVEVVAPTVNSNNADIIAVYGMFNPTVAPAGTSSAVAGRQTCIMQAYGGVDTSTPVDVAAVTTLGTLPVTLTGVTTVTGNARALTGITADFSTGTFTGPPGWYLEKTHTSGTGRGGALADLPVSAAGATGSPVWAASTNQAAVGYTLALRPAAAGGSTITGAAAVTGTGSVTATAQVFITGAATVSGTGSVTAAASVIVPGTASVTGAGSVTAGAAGAASGTATVVGAGSVTATVVQSAQSSVTGAGSVSAVTAQRAQSTPTGVGTVTATAVQAAGASVQGAGSVTANSGGSTTGAATVTGVGTVTATAVQAAGASVTGAGTVAAATTVRVTGTTVTGAGSTSAAAVQAAAASVTGTGTVTAGAAGSTSGTATTAGVGAVSAAASVIVRPSATTVTGAGAVSAAGSIRGSTSPTGVGSVTATASVVQRATASVIGVGSVTGSVGQTITATAAVTGSGSVAATGIPKYTARPYAGVTARPGSGITARPFTTVTVRP